VVEKVKEQSDNEERDVWWDEEKQLTRRDVV
jgi:hypothetical protein